MKILIVEDERALAIGLEDDLRVEGYDVVVLADGRVASQAALEGGFDAIVLDVMLPGRDGLEICRDIRRAGQRTPIIMLTAKAQESDKILGLELGADDYITKPFSPRELRARLKAVLRRAQRDLPDRYSFGSVEVDFSSCQLRQSGRVVDVTTLEYKLLSLFIRRRGHVLTRAQLLDDIWGSATHVTDRVIDTHIANLRKKIEDNPAAPRHLVSVRGIGYRFDG